MTQLIEPDLCSPCCLMSDIFVVLFIVRQCNHFIFLNIFFLILVRCQQRALVVENEKKNYDLSTWFIELHEVCEALEKNT